jgi:broad specificity phosphatase PhoE
VVTHQAVILAFRMALEGLTEQQILEIDRGQPLPNCSITR